MGAKNRSARIRAFVEQVFGSYDERENRKAWENLWSSLYRGMSEADALRGLVTDARKEVPEFKVSTVAIRLAKALDRASERADAFMVAVEEWLKSMRQDRQAERAALASFALALTRGSAILDAWDQLRHEYHVNQMPAEDGAETLAREGASPDLPTISVFAFEPGVVLADLVDALRKAGRLLEARAVLDEAERLALDGRARRSVRRRIEQLVEGGLRSKVLEPDGTPKPSAKEVLRVLPAKSLDDIVERCGLARRTVANWTTSLREESFIERVRGMWRRTTRGDELCKAAPAT